MTRIGTLRARWSAQSRLRRLGAAIAAATVTAGLVGVVVGTASGDGTPAPVVWRDHVVEPTTGTPAP